MCVFFFKQKTAYEMRISDWSSDVCSSDLWETILNANIIGCYNLFEAARKQGVKRVVFASSNHVMGFHQRTTKIGVEAVPKPDTRYGLSKLFGEGLGALYARSEEHTSELQSLMRISYAVFCLKKKKRQK